MSKRNLQVKHYQNYKRYLLAIGIILSIVVFASSIYAKNDTRAVTGRQITYLLGSGLTDCQKASVRYILWTEDFKQVDSIEKSLKENKIAWKREDLTNAYGGQAVKFTISRIVDKQQEAEIDSMINYLHNSFDIQKVGIFFEERINAGINPEDYFRLNNVNTDQGGQAEEIVALTGYADGILISPQSNTKFNIEVLSTLKTCSANLSEVDKMPTDKTVLAIPALIEEF